IATFTKQEKVQYEESLKYYRDLKNSFDTAFEEGEMKGEIKGEIKKSKQVAINAIKKGFDNQIISELTGLSILEIEKIRKNLDL
ncbi:MAG: hypothetical protein EAZ44_07260, partial [Cytophagia bacterium]